MTKTYITIDDVDNTTFKRFSTETQQFYVDLANSEMHDIAIRKGVDTDLIDPASPVHLKLKQYAADYAVMRLANANAGVSNDGRPDKYLDLYLRYKASLNDMYNDLTIVMWTDGKQTAELRASSGPRLRRG